MKRIVQAFRLALSELFQRWGVLLTMFLLYLLMLGAVYLFIATREATIGQLLLSLLLALAAPILFLIIQTIAARYVGSNLNAPRLLGSSSRDFWKLLVVAIPLILVAVLVAYFLSSGEPASTTAAVKQAVRSAAQKPAVAKAQPVHWQTVLTTTLQYLIFWLVLPLAAIQLWLATSRDGLVSAIKNIHRILARAVFPSSVIAYLIGFVLFAIAPYFLIVTRTPVTGAWLDAGLLVARLLVATLLSLVGWVGTVGALGALRQDKPASAVAQQSEGTGHVPVEA